MIQLQKEIFGSVCEGYKGDVNLGNKREYFTQVKDKGTLPLVRGIQISKYGYTPGNEYCYKTALSRDHTDMERIVLQEVANMGLAHRVKGTILQNVILGDSTNYIFSTRNDISNYSILAVLNSKVVNYYFKYFNQTNHVPIGELKQIPFPTVTPAQQQPIISLVETILTKKRNGEPTEQEEREIDLLIYKLYNLTEDEIKIIEC